MGANAGGFLASPPDLTGDPGLGIAGISGVARGRTWDAVASADCRGLLGLDQLTFVTFDDGTIVVDLDLPDDALAPLAEGLEETVDPPYRAAAIRVEGDLWTAVAERVKLVELPEVEEDVVDLSVVAGERELTVGEEQTTRQVPALDRLAEEHGDVSLHAERVDGDTFAVDVYPL
jgi:hypothetical protein